MKVSWPWKIVGPKRLKLKKIGRLCFARLRYIFFTLKAYQQLLLVTFCDLTTIIIELNGTLMDRQMNAVMTDRHEGWNSYLDLDHYFKQPCIWSKIGYKELTSSDIQLVSRVEIEALRCIYTSRRAKVVLRYQRFSTSFFHTKWSWV